MEVRVAMCEGHGCAEEVESINVECWEITGKVLCDSCAAEEFDRRAEYWSNEDDGRADQSKD